MRMRTNPRQGSKLMSSIDVSAFASIIVVLVAMFAMPASVVIDGGIAVDLPKVLHPKLVPNALREDAIIVWVMRNGDVFLGNDRVAPDELPGRIRERVSRGSKRTVYIRADARSKYRNVKEVLDETHSAGI